MITYPLNNIDYTAEDAELYFSTRHSGVYDGDDDFAVTVSGIDNDVIVGAGIAWIRNTKFSGKVAALKNPKTLTLDLADSVYDRIDAIVIRFDASENSSDVIVKKGTASSSPVPPSVSRTESLYELHIFHIHRRAGSATIGVNDVIDQRKNKDYCGVMFDPISSIDETLSKKGFAADAESVGKALENAGGIKMELLWENASLESAFSSATIPLDLSGYNLVLVDCLGYRSSASWRYYHFSAIAAVGSDEHPNYHKVLSFGEEGSCLAFRPFVVYGSKIVFASSRYTTKFSTTPSESTNLLIPTRIYGIKGVIGA